MTTTARYITPTLWIGDECDFPHNTARSATEALESMNRGILTLVNDATLAQQVLVSMGYSDVEAQRWVSWAQGGWADVEVDALEIRS